MEKDAPREENTQMNVLSSGAETSSEHSWDKVKEVENKTVIYGIDDRPPWTSVVLMGLQHFSVSFSGMLTMPLIIAGPLCMDLDRITLSQLIGTSFFMCGITTLLQTSIGSRLPIVQGASLTFVAPIIVMMRINEPCPLPLNDNATTEEVEFVRAVANERMQGVQGSLILASLVQVIVGFTGLVGLLLPLIGPITVATTLILIGVPLIPIASDVCGTHWGISSMCILLIVIFSQFLDKYQIPCPGRKKFPLFTFFPILLAVATTWIFCLILTITGVLSENPNERSYQARTDIYNEAIQNARWFRLPYPGQWGFPSATVAGVIGMFASIICGIIESVGDYYACALICGVPPPPVHAINRGVGMEGLGCLAAGFWGSGTGYTSYSNNVAAIGLTKIASRVVIYFCATLFLLCGIFAKFSAFCAALPQPIIGAMMATTFGMVASIGFANLKNVKVNTSRNLFILGLSLFVGIGLPDYLAKNPGSINTGSAIVDQVLTVVLGSSMLIGGFAACVLDNIVRGTPEEKGLRFRGRRWGKADEDMESFVKPKCYDLPCGMDWIRKREWTSHLPFSPTFSGFKKPPCCHCPSTHQRI